MRGIAGLYRLSGEDARLPYRAGGTAFQGPTLSGGGITLIHRGDAPLGPLSGLALLVHVDSLLVGSLDRPTRLFNRRDGRRRGARNLKSEFGFQLALAEEPHAMFRVAHDCGLDRKS